ncbi:MAG: GNAT family N-acetyltransferase [Myxococcota bacterium]
MRAEAAATRFRVLTSVREVEASAWNALVGETAVPVLRHEWLLALEASGSASLQTGWEPHHLTLWRGSALVGLAPAYRKHHSMGEYVYDFSWANAAEAMGVRYYPKLLVGPALSPLTAPRFHAAPGESLEVVRKELLAGALASAEETSCSSVHVIFPTAEEAAALEELGLARRTGMQYHWRNPGYRTYDDFLARFDAKRRHQLRRERRAASEQGLTLRTVRGSELTHAHAELAYRFYESTCSKYAWGRVQLNRGFFTRVFASLPQAIELVLAERAGQVVAGAFNLATAQRLYGRYWGAFEEHPFLHFHVCLYHSIDDCIRLGRQVFEPGAGGEHKVSRGFQPTPIHSAHRIFHPQLEAAVRRFVERERAELAPILARSEELAGLRRPAD